MEMVHKLAVQEAQRVNFTCKGMSLPVMSNASTAIYILGSLHALQWCHRITPLFTAPSHTG